MVELIHFFDYFGMIRMNCLYLDDDEQHGKASTMTGITGVDDDPLKSYRNSFDVCQQMNQMTLQSNEYNEKKRKKNENFLFSTEAVERFSIKVFSFLLLLLFFVNHTCFFCMKRKTQTYILSIDKKKNLAKERLSSNLFFLSSLKIIFDILSFKLTC